jgi:hypothetical protein
MILMLLAVPCLVTADDVFKLSKNIRQTAKDYGFKIVIKPVLPSGLTGGILPAEQAEAELARFFSALDDLGIKFVRKSGLKNVIIVRDLKNSGKPIAGHTRDDCIYLKKGFSKKTVYHEMFHVFDNKREDKVWQRLNHRDFRYRGISYPKRPLPEKKQRDLNKHYRKVQKNFDADFASSYAQTKEREDRAETFARMVCDGKLFAERAAKSPVLYAKMQYIIKMTGKRSLMDEDYWRRKLGDKAFINSKK